MIFIRSRNDCESDDHLRGCHFDWDHKFEIRKFQFTSTSHRCMRQQNGKPHDQQVTTKNRGDEIVSLIFQIDILNW